MQLSGLHSINIEINSFFNNIEFENDVVKLYINCMTYMDSRM